MLSVSDLSSLFSLYVHGGRDLKEGSIATMWRLNLSNIHSQMADDGSADGASEWELVPTTGKGPGRISHHTVSVRPDKQVLFYGGLKGEDSNPEVFLFNPNTNSWLTVTTSVSIGLLSLVYECDFALTNYSCIERFRRGTSP